MSFPLSFLRGCLPCVNSSPYHPLPKKDDDLPIQQAEAWVESQPITDKMKYLSLTAAKNYGRQIIKNLKEICIDSSNEDKIREHLVKICQKSNLVQQYLVAHLGEINADKNIIVSLRDQVMCTFPPPY